MVRCLERYSILMSQFLYHVPKYVPKSWTLFLFDFDETEGVQMRIWNSYYLKSIKYARARPRRIFKDSCRNSEFGVVCRVQYLRKGIVCTSACLFLGHHFYVPEWGLSCNLAHRFLVQTSYIQYYRTGRPGTSFLCPRYFWDIKMMYQICFPRALRSRGTQVVPIERGRARLDRAPRLDHLSYLRYYKNNMWKFQTNYLLSATW